ELIDHTVRAIRNAVSAECRVNFSIQTNGVLLDTSFLDLFVRHGMTVGVSLDGGRLAHDRHRRHADGRGSFGAVEQALRLLDTDDYRSVYSGLLCTIDVQNDPIGVYDDLLAFVPPQIDFLLPHGNWDTPPPGRPAGLDRSRYADWLIAIFDRWFDAPVRETRIRLFDSIIGLLFGLPSESEAVGLSQIDLITVETDGTWEQGDALKTVGTGAAGTGCSLRSHSLDDLLAHPGVMARQRGIDALAPQCQACPIVAVCGGGLYAHRYRSDSGFANPSVYCGDLMALIGHIRTRVEAGVRALPPSWFVGAG
ncbi:MAG TPA: FxsB family cyclophane-forming radical SAM/SPASM peptide maturase, partial [Nakamurella sp.]